MIAFFAISFIVFFSCKKEKNTDKGYLMTVKEAKTNMPIPGVTIQLFKCSRYDEVFGCRSQALFATHVTDDKGQYRFNAELNQANEGVVLKKSGYWDGGGGEGERFLTPLATADIHLTTQANYPDTSNFQITTSNGVAGESIGPFRPPKDSIIHLHLAGNDVNQLSWSVFYQDPKCYIYCPRDSFASGSFSLSAAKHETVKYELAY